MNWACYGREHHHSAQHGCTFSFGLHYLVEVEKKHKFSEEVALELWINRWNRQCQWMGRFSSAWCRPLCRCAGEIASQVRLPGLGNAVQLVPGWVSPARGAPSLVANVEGRCSRGIVPALNIGLGLARLMPLKRLRQSGKRRVSSCLSGTCLKPLERHTECGSVLFWELCSDFLSLWNLTIGSVSDQPPSAWSGYAWNFKSKGQTITGCWSRPELGVWIGQCLRSKNNKVSPCR